MKFMISSGQAGLLISLCLCMTACKESEEYFPTVEAIMGADAQCSPATDLNSCQQLEGCQPAFDPSEDETQEPKYVACVANPVPTSISTPPDEPVADGTVTDGSVTDATDSIPSDGVVADGSEAPAGSISDPVTDPALDQVADEPTPSPAPAPAPAPSLQDAWSSKCANLDEEYLFVKKITSKDSTHFVSKVKVCHMRGNGDSHTIVIACPALKAHAKHDDYLGACAQ